jgi:very-short-patch-repair endonuclease
MEGDMADPASGGAPPKLGVGLFRSVLGAYAEFLRRQGAAATAYTRWSRTSSRALEFLWLGDEIKVEEVVLSGQSLKIAKSSPLFPSVQRMHATSRLNPYEREIRYGYPFVVGMRSSKPLRGPLLSTPVSIEPEGAGFSIQAAEESLRFNALPFQSEFATPVVQQAVQRMLAEPAPLPLTRAGLRKWLDVFSREFPDVDAEAALDGSLIAPPSEPKGSEGLRLIDQAALFVASQTNYFLVSDLEEMQEAPAAPDSALTALLEGAGDDTSVEVSLSNLDANRLSFPFPSNRAQRKIAFLLEDERTQVVRVEGPPGTGKSLTISNLACHMAASGRSVLITSTKDKALQVVDEKLHTLGIPGFPMTLLRREKDAKRALLDRIAEVRKTRSEAEVREHSEQAQAHLNTAAEQYSWAMRHFPEAKEWERRVVEAVGAADSATGLRRLLRRIRANRTIKSADREAPRATDELAELAATAEEERREGGLLTLQSGVELAVASATRGQRQNLNELTHLLRRDQKSARNYSIFDRMKREPERAQTLLRLLPVWIMAPDDVARLFPNQPGLFDVVIVDEASQVDLPSIFPVLHRAKKLVVSGDTKQMQPKRFAFIAKSLADEAWSPVLEYDDSLSDLLHPTDESLLELAFVRAQEENLLDEHFRSLPGIIDFSNNRWYQGRLRIMTDERKKRFGGPTQPSMEVHQVTSGKISNNSQENEVEAQALVDHLLRLTSDPDYHDASIGVIALFEEQVELIQELVLEKVSEEVWENHDLVVVNPDGFQGDERDVILYSLSWDNDLMNPRALAARQQNSSHVQGMLNVAFTRARDEVHIFCSAPIESFSFADGSPGAIGDWLAHAKRYQERGRVTPIGKRSGRVDSEFEADVAESLRARGVEVTHQYPACGYWIDLACELDGRRIGVECDGEPWHQDEHGQRLPEDLERLAVLRRAGWVIVNIPYRNWIRAPGSQVERVLEALGSPQEQDDPPEPSDPQSDAPAAARRLSVQEIAILKATSEGSPTQDDVLYRARDLLRHKRLSASLRSSFLTSAQKLNHAGLLVIEDGEFFLTPNGRSIEPGLALPPPEALQAAQPKSTRPPRRKRQSPQAPTGRSAGKCACGGEWRLRSGRYGHFYGCSNYPRCRRTKSYP